MATIIMRQRASTLIEVLVAMVILLICFSIGMASIMQLNNKQNPTVTMKATFILQQYINTTIEKKAYTDEEIENNGFIIRRKINTIGNRQDILCVYFDVYAPGMNKVIIEQNKIVVNEK